MPAFDDDPALVTMLVDPFSFPAGSFLRLLNEEHAGLPVVGGIAAGAGAPGAQVLIVDDEHHASGVVGATVSGVPVRTIVSQGCAPIGRDSVVTHAEANVVFELAGQPALERLKEDLASLPPERLRLAANGLLVGLVIDENRAEYGRGDYLVRALLGADEETGAIAVGDEVRVGPDAPLPRARRRLRRRGPARVARRRPGGRDGRGRAAVHLQRPRHAHVLRAGPRRPRPGRGGRLV